MSIEKRILWFNLCFQNFSGVQFYCQQPIDDLIVDFFAPAVKLAVEVEDSVGEDNRQSLNDRYKDEYLAVMGMEVLRFSRLDVLVNTDWVVESIQLAVEKILRTGKLNDNPH